MSPEALVTDGHLDGRADVFSLGLVLYEMLAGRLPHGSHQVGRTDTPRRPVESLLTLRPDVPPDLDALVRRATQPDLQSRLPSVREFTDALSRMNAADRREARLRTRVRDASGWIAVTGLALALGAGVFAAYARHAALPDPGRVVVADFANETGLPALDPVGEMAGDIVAGALSRAPGLTVINAAVALGTRQRSPSPSADSILTREMLALVRDTHAGVVVTGSYYTQGARLTVLAEVTDTRSGRVLGVVGPLPVDTASDVRGLEGDRRQRRRRREAPLRSADIGWRVKQGVPAGAVLRRNRDRDKAERASHFPLGMRCGRRRHPMLRCAPLRHPPVGTREAQMVAPFLRPFVKSALACRPSGPVDRCPGQADDRAVHEPGVAARPGGSEEVGSTRLDGL
jgi:TolB-like protein